jgi:PadR family transcriptional regulator, regulatory protein PadR
LDKSYFPPRLLDSLGDAELLSQTILERGRYGQEYGSRFVAGDAGHAGAEGGFAGALHGYGVLLRIQQIWQDRLEVQQGSLYPALYRLEHEGWIAGEWGQSENKRRARYYRLTAAGRRRLEVETKKWNQFAEVIGVILNTAAEGL